MKIAILFSKSLHSQAMTELILSQMLFREDIVVYLLLEAPSFLKRLISRTRRSGGVATLRYLASRTKITSTEESSDWQISGELNNYITKYKDRFLKCRDAHHKDVVRWITNEKISLICLVDAGGIIRKSLIQAVDIGIINAHGGGKLPYIRGSDALEWSLLLRHRPWVNTHFVDKGIDTGPLLLQEPISIDENDNLKTLCFKRDRLRVDLIVKTIYGIADKTLQAKAQNLSEGKTYYRMHLRLRRLLNEKIKKIISELRI